MPQEMALPRVPDGVPILVPAAAAAAYKEIPQASEATEVITAAAVVAAKTAVAPAAAVS